QPAAAAHRPHRRLLQPRNRPGRHRELRRRPPRPLLAVRPERTTRPTERLGQRLVLLQMVLYAGDRLLRQLLVAPNPNDPNVREPAYQPQTEPDQQLRLAVAGRRQDHQPATRHDRLQHVQNPPPVEPRHHRRLTPRRPEELRRKPQEVPQQRPNMGGLEVVERFREPPLRLRPPLLRRRLSVLVTHPRIPTSHRRLIHPERPSTLLGRPERTRIPPIRKELIRRTAHLPLPQLPQPRILPRPRPLISEPMRHTQIRPPRRPPPTPLPILPHQRTRPPLTHKPTPMAMPNPPARLHTPEPPRPH